MRLSLLLLALFLSACGSASRSYAPAPEATAVYTGEADVVSMRGGRSEEVAYYRDGVAVNGGTQAEDRQLIRNASLGLKVEEDAQAEDIVAQATALADALGGYVASQDTRGAVLRIPDARLDEALITLSELGEVTARDVSAVDVTAQYTDLQIRLDNARALRDRLAALLQEASGVEDVLAVERELARVTTDVERLEGQMRLLQNQIAFSTVRLSVRVDGGSRPGPLGYVFIGLYEVVKWLFVWD